MSVLGDVLYALLSLLLFLLFARMILSYVLALTRYRPSGYMVVLFEIVYTVTDLPLRPLERVLPPIRIGQFAFSLAYLVLYVAIIILLPQVGRL
ncbi:MAG TPA: YggT family protein [Mycobacteriales bacterium]|jgi:YggT family protein|nr:YggT family protein [Mycobacteriales bacterium]